MMRIHVGKITVLCVVILASVNRAEPSNAQTLLGLKVDEPSTLLTPLGAPNETGSYKGMALKRWNRLNGNELSVTIDQSGKIVYLESDWNGRSPDTGCDLPDLRFGITTLAQLRKRFGSNGFSFQNRPPAIQVPDGVVMINSFEVGSAVVTFYTKIDRDEFSRLKASGANPSPAEYARLDAVSIANDSYAKSEWGERIYDPEYKKIKWK